VSYEKVAMPSVEERYFREIRAGGFSRLDGTIQFYLRVNALLSPDMTVVDLGAGRGAASDDRKGFRRDLATLKGKVREVIGVDVDPAVLENPIVDRALVYDGHTLPLADNSADLIVSDHTFEHVTDPATFAREAGRILKPGGWLCARTPYHLSAVAAVSSMVPNRLHSGLLSAIQPRRKAFDVFPTAYRLNSFARLKRYFPLNKWENASYTWSPEPAYHFDNRFVFGLMLALDAVKRPLFGGEVLLVFLQKKI
jgi:SAM-dependent methyltransferase